MFRDSELEFDVHANDIIVEIMRARLGQRMGKLFHFCLLLFLVEVLYMSYILCKTISRVVGWEHGPPHIGN